MLFVTQQVIMLCVQVIMLYVHVFVTQQVIMLYVHVVCGTRGDHAVCTCCMYR